MKTLLLFIILFLPVKQEQYTKVRIYDIHTKVWSEWNFSANKFIFLDNGNVKHINLNEEVEIYTKTSTSITKNNITTYYLKTPDNFNIKLKLYSDYISIEYPNKEKAEFKN